MKFHCDRCKTKYSISDDRVRGKILKIRCKNCSGVITVREPGAPAMPVTQPSAAQPTAPAAQARRRPTAGQEALAGAFKKAVNDPASSAANMRAVSSPVSLDAEWYLSKDGNQEGPFTMDQARSWVSSRLPEDELYCWSEGYDDWLPVEKVSHFRGIRASTFSDLDSSEEQTMIGQSMDFGSDPETPKPLFAATMEAVADGQSEPLDDELRFPEAAAPVRAASVAPPIPGGGRAPMPLAASKPLAAAAPKPLAAPSPLPMLRPRPCPLQP